jgi:RNA polymerase sigma-70 factor, ECF subfamily
LSPELPDERLKLLSVCAHPAIDAAMQTPLMLQTVLGLDAARIAQAFLIAPKTMGQHLFRATTKIRSGGIRRRGRGSERTGSGTRRSGLD